MSAPISISSLLSRDGKDEKGHVQASASAAELATTTSSTRTSGPALIPSNRRGHEEDSPNLEVQSRGALPPWQTIYEKQKAGSKQANPSTEAHDAPPRARTSNTEWIQQVHSSEWRQFDTDTLIQAVEVELRDWKDVPHYVAIRGDEESCKNQYFDVLERWQNYEHQKVADLVSVGTPLHQVAQELGDGWTEKKMQRYYDDYKEGLARHHFYYGG